MRNGNSEPRVNEGSTPTREIEKTDSYAFRQQAARQAGSRAVGRRFNRLDRLEVRLLQHAYIN
jgi:hypothetical protein